jgi:hypothetical protein
MSQRLRMALLVLGFAHIASSGAIVVNEQAFKDQGGDPGNITGTIAKANQSLVERSYADPFLVVGHIDNCTATWLGEAGGYSYILTAAHCTESDQKGGVVRVNRRFVAWNGQVIAGGQGWRYLHPYRLSIPAHMGGASTDVSIMKLPRKATPVDAQGKPVRAPILYDGRSEVNKTVHFAGYGTWGVGTAVGPWGPARGPRRMWASSVITGIWEGEHGIGAAYRPQGKSVYWGGLASGDSGSAWWQQHNGYWNIIATTNGTANRSSTGARLSQYVGWIKGLFPLAVSQTDRMTVTERTAFVSRNHAEDVSKGTVYYRIPAGQPNATGSIHPFWSSKGGHSVIRVQLKDSISGAHAWVNLRGQRDNGCWQSYMEEAALCYDYKQGPLTVSFHAQDNPGLPSGVYRGDFDVEAAGWHERDYRQGFTLHADIHHLVRARVTATTPFKSDNLAAIARKGTVSYVVPVQPDASGPLQPSWGSSRGALSRIRATVQDAVTLASHTVVLRAARDNGCYWVNMEDAQICYGERKGPLLVWFEAQDNPSLPPGLHRGKLIVQARGWHDAAVREPIEIELELDTSH